MPSDVSNPKIGQNNFSTAHLGVYCYPFVPLLNNTYMPAISSIGARLQFPTQHAIPHDAWQG
jgi:hypothetical protein